MNRKATATVCSLTMLLICCSVNAQTGIYASEADYKTNTLSYAADGKKSTIHLHDFFADAPCVTIVSDGVKHKLKKADLYGYRDSHNKAYRFYNNASYLIAEAGDLYIYTKTENVAQDKGFKVVNRYYFSKGADGDVLALTIGNLRAAFAGNDQFLELLGKCFEHSDVAEYDGPHKTFRVNYLYQKALQP